MDIDKILERVKFLTESYLFEGRKPAGIKRGGRLAISWQHLKVLIDTCRDYLDKVELSIPLLMTYQNDSREVLRRKKECHKCLVQVLDLLSKIYYHIQRIGEDDDEVRKGITLATQELLQEEGEEAE